MEYTMTEKEAHYLIDTRGAEKHKGRMEAPIFEGPFRDEHSAKIAIPHETSAHGIGVSDRFAIATVTEEDPDFIEDDEKSEYNSFLELGDLSDEHIWVKIRGLPEPLPSGETWWHLNEHIAAGDEPVTQDTFSGIMDLEGIRNVLIFQDFEGDPIWFALLFDEGELDEISLMMPPIMAEVDADDLDDEPELVDTTTEQPRSIQ